MGIVVLVVGAVCAYFARSARARQHAMITTDTLSAQELGALQQAAVQAAGPGAFRYRVEVTGQLCAGEAGPLRSELAKVDCVWHRHVVTRKYWETRRDRKGSSRRVSRTEVVSQHSSGQPFRVQDPSGVVTVYPGDVAVDGAQKVLDRFERDTGGGQATLQLGKFRMSIPAGDSGTDGYQYEEWVLRPGRRAYVLGEASDGTGELAITDPLIVSTRTEAELLARSHSRQQAFTIAAVVAAVGGVASTAVGLVQIFG
ncbi:GIDE domain-containing protein [Actinopolymorpha sp. NPDC004070]|uniref:GIDE domain-containing protein n=1 Tax=Actinopolymorpha sp. NPDC004070 TaxID=3154548 RepID=UPI0033A88F51